jgi:hypothetical protein
VLLKFNDEDDDGDAVETATTAVTEQASVRADSEVPDAWDAASSSDSDDGDSLVEEETARTQEDTSEPPAVVLPTPVPDVRHAGDGGPGSTPVVHKGPGGRAGLPATSKAELTERNTLLAMAAAAEAACSIHTQRSLGNVDEVRATYVLGTHISRLGLPQAEGTVSVRHHGACRYAAAGHFS